MDQISILHLQRIAEEEGFKEIATCFQGYLRQPRRYMRRRYRKLLANVMGNKVFERGEKVFWYCRKCGYVHFGTKPLKNCPACLHPSSYFEVLCRRTINVSDPDDD
ncbi:MAG: hypothetical protein MZV63_62200 [Marinilabiliales bacterium]|nr:hypothetical protein [Marinilabiliales bacterium]